MRVCRLLLVLQSSDLRLGDGLSLQRIISRVITALVRYRRIFAYQSFTGPVGANTSFPLLLVANEAGEVIMTVHISLLIHGRNHDRSHNTSCRVRTSHVPRYGIVHFLSRAINTATYFPGSTVITLNSTGVRSRFFSPPRTLYILCLHVTAALIDRHSIQLSR
jgi:hypothetical protein